MPIVKFGKGLVVGQFEFVLKGRGFSRAVRCAKSIAAFSRRGNAGFKSTHYRSEGPWCLPAAAIVQRKTGSLTPLGMTFCNQNNNTPAFSMCLKPSVAQAASAISVAL